MKKASPNPKANAFLSAFHPNSDIALTQVFLSEALKESISMSIFI